MSRPDGEFTPVPAHQLAILRNMQLPIFPAAEIEQMQPAELIIDGIIGYSLNDAPRGDAASLIRWANRQNVPILALDTPSGVDTTTGTAFDPSIHATATMTLALPKMGLRAAGVEAQVGELYLADISVPPALYASPKLALQIEPIFAASDIVRLR
ncbi:MAG: hypothetical protein HC893_01855 [Chloroflexaceae bacterium]|nr:hypothetical protein [Chloroflexaceae bacterium]